MPHSIPEVDRERIWIPSLLGSALLLLASVAHTAVIVDGTLDPEYSAPLAVQANQTSLNDAVEGQLFDTHGSELDAAYGFIADGTLHLFLAGNVAFCCGYEFSTISTFDFFFDSGAGGQNTLRSDNPAVGYPETLAALAGLTFDTDLAPDYWIGGWAGGAYSSDLPTGSGGTANYLGRISTGAPGTLTEGRIYR